MATTRPHRRTRPRTLAERKQIVAARHAKARAECKWKLNGSTREENAWPGGPSWRRCLNCDRAFISTSKDHRLCTACREEP